MSQDNDIGAHGLKIAGRIYQGFPFLDAAAGRRKTDRICAEPLGSHLKGGLGSRTGLIEKIHHTPASQGRHLFYLSL